MKFTFKFFFTLILLGWSLLAVGQDESFHALFQKAFNCTGCSDSVQIAHYSAAIEHGISETTDLGNFHNSLVNRAQMAARNGNFEMAIKDYKLAIDIMPDSYNVRKRLGTLLLENGQYQESIDQFSSFISRAEAEMKESVSFYESETNEFDQMRESAIQEWNKLLAPVYNNRALAKGYSGDHSAACKDFRKAFKLGMIELYDFLDENCRE